MNKVLLSILSLLFILPCSAQTSSDTLAVKSNFKAGELIMPLSLVGVGALGFIEPVKAWHHGLHDKVSIGAGDNTIKADEYLRFVPMAGIYGLSLLGADAKHGYMDRTLELGVSFVALTAIGYGCKYLIHSPRPNGSDNNSFPSGHTATTFMGAELVRIEYGEEHPWLAVGAYTVATAVGALRVYNDCHWFNDVIAGAGVGILSARIGYWLLPYTRQIAHRITGWDMFVAPTASSTGAALNTVIRF
jgi:hypothetical protein